MELIKDLGTRRRASGGSYRWGVYRCPQCNKEYELVVSTVNYRKRLGGANICHACANREKAVLAGKIKSDITKESYLNKFIDVHGNRYDYSKFVYIGAWDKSVIICKDHGEFLQPYADHALGHGCPSCAAEENIYGLRKDTVLAKPTKLYYLYFPELNLWKVGCTSNSLAKRFIEDKQYTYQILFLKEYATGYEAYEVERWILRHSFKNAYEGPQVLCGGNSELRTKPIKDYQIVIKMAEASFKITQRIIHENQV